MPDKETFAGLVVARPAQGVLMTEIHCPSCEVRFHLEGDCDRVQVECPYCQAQLVVTRK